MKYYTVSTYAHGLLLGSRAVVDVEAERARIMNDNLVVEGLNLKPSELTIVVEECEVSL